MRHRFLYREIDRQLEAWGRWMTKYHDVRGGYSPVSSYVMVMEGAGGSVPGHRVLMGGAPDHIQLTNKRIAYLISQQQTAVFMMHVGTHDCEGMVLTVKQRCRLNNLNEEEMLTDFAAARVALVAQLSASVEASIGRLFKEPVPAIS